MRLVRLHSYGGTEDDSFDNLFYLVEETLPDSTLTLGEFWNNQDSLFQWINTQRGFI